MIGDFIGEHLGWIILILIALMVSGSIYLISQYDPSSDCIKLSEKFNAQEYYYNSDYGCFLKINDKWQRFSKHADSIVPVVAPIILPR
jgi:hypothetical protein